MKPYVIQSFRSDRGEVTQARVLSPGGGGLRTVELPGAALTLTPEPDTLYRCGELTELTISDPPALGAWMIVFRSGETPTRTTVPDSVLGLEKFAAEADTVYELNVIDGRALAAAWESAAEPGGAHA